MRLKLRLPREKASQVYALYREGELSAALGQLDVTITDEDVISAFYTDNLEAFEEIKRRYSAELLVYLRRNCNREQHAWDILEGSWNGQDGIFQRVYQTYAREEGARASGARQFSQGSFRSWLMTIARRMVYDANRKGKRDKEIAWPESEEDYQWEPFNDPQQEQKEKEISEEQRAAVHRCLAQLDSREREALSMFLALGRRPPLTELAAALDRSVSQASRVLKQAYDSMRQCLSSK